MRTPSANLVDSVASDDPAGTLVLYRKEDILRETPAQRLDPHSSALSECLMTAEMLGSSPPRRNSLPMNLVSGGATPNLQRRSKREDEEQRRAAHEI
ncbi:MAG: hypothetical protein ABR881_00780 [Candidatus Sulfotelmatobacter sp.]|jgi:hypothetical protein